MPEFTSSASTCRQSPSDPVYLDLFGDTPRPLQSLPSRSNSIANLTREAEKLYASHHYGHYDFLYLLSDKVGGVGLEHHQSSEDGSRANYFTDWAGSVERTATCLPTNTHIPGMENSAAPPICGRPTSMFPCRMTCSGL